MSVRLILDTSALLAYAAADLRSVAVGELIATVAEDGDVTGVPALCLVAAVRQSRGGDRGRLIELATTPDGPTILLPLLADDVLSVAAASIEQGLAHAVAEAGKYHAVLATYLGDEARRELPDDDILDL